MSLSAAGLWKTTWKTWTASIFSFSHQISIVMIYALRRLWGGKRGGKGKPFMAYCDPYGKNIYFPHIWFNTVCTFVRHMWKNAKRGEFLWKQTDYMAKNLSVEVRFIYCIVNCMFWYCIGDQDVWGNVELCLVKPTRDSQSIHVSCFSCVTRNPSAECIVPVSCT